MKSVIAAVAMLLLLTLTLAGTKNITKCTIEKRAKAGNLEWQNNSTQAASMERVPAC
mgnify:CR=1 FL=1